MGFVHGLTASCHGRHITTLHLIGLPSYLHELKYVILSVGMMNVG